MATVRTESVNLRYLEMADPKINFLLVGVTRAKDHDFAKNDDGKIEAGEMLDGLERHKKEGRVPGNHDVVYLMTGLGSPHDETPECPWAEGYLMSYVDGGLKKYKLSACSQQTIRQNVKKLSQECFSVLSEKNYMTDHKKFPGQTVRAQYVCKKLIKKQAKGRKVFAQKGYAPENRSDTTIVLFDAPKHQAGTKNRTDSPDTPAADTSMADESSGEIPAIPVSNPYCVLRSEKMAGKNSFEVGPNTFNSAKVANRPKV
ncbi:hypothetical protein HPB49_016417 [Dermacentor silvarum]|uniref:Uncharacterized protein n=1 Tax=Dermacentor silvarum TaxID=543639 RepID=A0ACB8C4F5_DERSI|nr:hypothetical protein HPB49_016417 [Dermacentor silvarum]